MARIIITILKDLGKECQQTVLRGIYFGKLYFILGYPWAKDTFTAVLNYGLLLTLIIKWFNEKYQGIVDIDGNDAT